MSAGAGRDPELGEEPVLPAGGMSLSVTQPAVREWLGKRRAALRPVGTFCNTANFQVRWQCDDLLFS
jgi:hypothetical protein